MEKHIVVKHNAAIRSAYRMSLDEQRMMLMCITQVRRDSKNDRQFTIRHDDFCERFGTTGAYKHMRDAAKRLQQRIITINEPIIDATGKKWDGGCISLLSAQFWNEGEGEIQLRFSPEFMPYLEQLRGNHTKFGLADIAKMNSVYAIRFYELFKMHYEQQKNNKNTPHVVVSVDEIRRMFELEEKYPRHQSFKKRVIDAAIDEINEYSPLHVEYEQVKKGRRVHAYAFKVNKKASKLEMKNTANLRDRKAAIKAIEEALAAGRDVSIMGKHVKDVVGGLICFDGSSANAHALMTECDCVFEIA